MRWLIMILLGLMAAGGLAATDMNAAKKVSTQELIEDLGDERYPVRVQATQALWQRGVDVLEALVKAEANASVEVALRAREVRRKIQLGIYPDSPPEIVELVTAYDGSSQTKRVEIIKQLKQLKAWPQVLRLHAMERDPDVRAELSSHLNGVAVQAARSFLKQEVPDFDRAREMLELGPANPRHLLALASLHRFQGSLKSELARARGIEGKRGHLWRYALHLMAGETLMAASEAEAAEEFLLAARLRLLTGDPTDYLRLSPVPDLEIPPVFLDGYRDAVLARWHGERVPEDFVDTLREAVRGSDEDDRWRSLALLYALGFSEQADEIFEKLKPTDAFFYYQSSERIDRALGALGLNPDNPDYSGWLRQRMERIAERLGDAEDDLRAVKYLAYFLEQRGLDEALREGLTQPLIELAKADRETFLHTIGMLFPSGQEAYVNNLIVAAPVIESAAVYAGDDPARIEQILERMFGELSLTQDVWSMLNEFRPEMNVEERLRSMAMMFGRMPDTGGRIDAWWQWLEKKRGQMEGNALANHLGLMVTYAMHETNAEKFLELAADIRDVGMSLDQLGKFSRRFAFQRFEWQCLLALGYYDELLERLKEQFDGEPEGLVSKAYLAAAMRSAGKHEEAKKIEEKLELLILSDVQSMVRIASAYEEFGVFDRSFDWLKRAMLESADSGDKFIGRGEKLLAEAKEQGDWKLVASLTEMLLLQEVMTLDELDLPSLVVRSRIEADMSWALDRLERDRSKSLARLEQCYQLGLTDGSMADYFFPAIREAGLTAWHDRWFESSWESLQAVIERFPASHNTMNTLAWTAARANRRLDEAKAISHRSIELSPGQAAYLDTMGEIHFAGQRREKAVKWGKRAISRQPYGTPIIRQFQKFRQGPFPHE